MQYCYHKYATKLCIKLGNSAFCLKLGHFVVRKIIKFVANRCRLRRLRQTGSNICIRSAPLFNRHAEIQRHRQTDRELWPSVEKWLSVAVVDVSCWTNSVQTLPPREPATKHPHTTHYSTIVTRQCLSGRHTQRPSSTLSLLSVFGCIAIHWHVDSN